VRIKSINKMRRNKRGFQVSFAWIFAIIAGAFILFLAIYGVTKIMERGGEVTSAKTGVELRNLLDPLETGFEAGRTVLLKMPVETRIYNKYNMYGNFGEQIIGISQKSFGKWSQTEDNPGLKNKYIFSKSVIEGKNFFIFSKPFEFPFKIADVIYLTSSEQDYCFINAPEEIEEELSDLNQENLLIENCPTTKSINVCFDPGFGPDFQDCDINIDTGNREVEKGNQIMFFETDALMYAAIFSDKSVYEYQIKRLMKRANELLLLYDDKAMLLSAQECPLDVNIFVLRNAINNVQDSGDLAFAANAAEDLERENDYAECRLW
jgi:hypothetical protein